MFMYRILTLTLAFLCASHVGNMVGDQEPAASQSASGTSDSPSPKLRVSQGVMDGLIVQRVDPVYPPEALRNHIQGIVLLQATIGKDGRVRTAKAVSGPPELFEASISAVEQWQYRPYRLNGEPVEVDTTIKIQFHLSKKR